MITISQAMDSIRSLKEIDGRSVKPTDSLGALLLALKLDATAGEKWSEVLSKVLDKVAKDLPMLSEQDAWAAIWRQGPIVEGDNLKPDSATFMRDCLQVGDKKPEAGADSPYGRLDDDTIWARHCLELKLKAYVLYLSSWVPADPDDRPLTAAKFPAPTPKRGSSVLTRDEAKYYLRYKALPANLSRV